jgi:lambda family phage portal protein
MEKRGRGRPPKAENELARAVVDAYRKAKEASPTEPDAAVKGETKTAVQARYQAAGQGRRLAGWNPPASGPNRALDGLQTIRNRARDSSRNDWSGASATQKWATSLVGIGITPRFKRLTDKTRKQFIVDLWSDFVSKSDADGVLNFYGQQTLAVRSWLDAGEVFMRRRPRFLDEGFPVPVQFQLLEAEMIPLLDADSYPGLPSGNIIRSGIEFNKRGRRIAYWIYKQHPGDGGKGVMPTSDELVRVAASDICHVFEPLRPGQIRGVSMLAPILARLRTIEDYDDATLTRQQLANLVVAFISKKTPPVTGDEDLNGLTGDYADSDDEGRPLVGLQPGLVQELDDGQEVQWSNPPEAGTTYSDYMRTQHLGTAAAAGIPYELFSGDILNISDRTLRVMINEFRRLAEQRQWQIVIPQMCVPAITWFADAAALAGLIAVDEYDLVRRAEWAPHGWAHIHPVQDPQGKLLEIDGGLRSRSSVIGERGDDPDAVDEERALDQAREEALGLPSAQPNNAQPNNAQPNNAQPNPAQPGGTQNGGASDPGGEGEQTPAGARVLNIRDIPPRDPEKVPVGVCKVVNRKNGLIESITEIPIYKEP